MHVRSGEFFAYDVRILVVRTYYSKVREFFGRHFLRMCRACYYAHALERDDVFVVHVFRGSLVVALNDSFDCGYYEFVVKRDFHVLEKILDKRRRHGKYDDAGFFYHFVYVFGYVKFASVQFGVPDIFAVVAVFGDRFYYVRVSYIPMYGVFIFAEDFYNGRRPASVAYYGAFR